MTTGRMAMVTIPAARRSSARLGDAEHRISRTRNDTLRVVIPLQACASRSITELLARQPLSPGKVRTAWRLAVGAAGDRASRVELDAQGVLRVVVNDEHWLRELERSRPLIRSRLEKILGPESVERIAIVLRDR